MKHKTKILNIGIRIVIVVIISISFAQQRGLCSADTLLTFYPSSGSPIDDISKKDTYIDSDADGVSDDLEILLNTNPLDPNDIPNAVDSDADGVSDDLEILLNTNPLDPNDTPNAVNSDADGISEGIEMR